MKGLLRIKDPVVISDSEMEELINSSMQVPEQPKNVAERGQQTASGDDAQSMVSFLITKTGNIDLNISWDEADEATAKNLATVLFLINSGAFETNCANLLVNMAQEDLRNMPFVRSIMTEWNHRRATEPLVKPSEVFQFGTLGTQE